MHWGVSDKHEDLIDDLAHSSSPSSNVIDSLGLFGKSNFNLLLAIQLRILGCPF